MSSVPQSPVTSSRGAVFRAAVVLVPLLLLLGGLSARMSGSTEANPWYQSLTLSPLQPPGLAFPIAWSILYTLIGVAAALVWARPGGRGKALALGLFALQFALNLAWSPLFFQQHMMLPALVLIGAMLLASIATTFAFARVSRVAAWLMLPYLVWLGFAAALNYDAWRLNPDADAFTRMA